jgi:hypothetical protein
MHHPETFQAQLDTSFQLNDDPAVRLRLVEVTDQGVTHGIRQFSLFFHGPADRVLRAGTYSFFHQSLGPLELFIVPVRGSNDERIVYEACFSAIVPEVPEG